MAEQPVTIEIARVFDAPRERVWREWTEAEAFADWFGGPAEVPLSTVTMDVRPGGRWHLTMRPTDLHAEILWRGESLEVDEPERLVFTITDRPEEVYALITVVLRDLGDGRTEMLFEQHGPLPPEAVPRARDGWSSFFDRIAERLAA